MQHESAIARGKGPDSPNQALNVLALLLNEPEPYVLL